MSFHVTIGLAAFAFLTALGTVLWTQTGAAVFATIVETGLIYCQ